MAETTDSNATIFKLTEKQVEFLESCEKEFANRYTDEDPDYIIVKETGIEPPPIMDPWYNKPRRNYDWAGKQQGRNDRYRNQNSGDRYRHDQNSGDRYRNSDRNYRDNKYRPRYQNNRYNPY